MTLGSKRTEADGKGNNSAFAIAGCQHPHISIFIEEMLALGHGCAGIYDAGDQTLARQIAEQYQLPFVDSMEELLVNDKVQYVASSAINNEKIQIAAVCERYGKHLMLDKPAVVDRAGLDQLEQITHRGKIQIGMLLTERYRPSLSTLYDLIRKDELGQLISITMRKPHRLRPDTRPEWHFSKEQSGGIIIDLLIHDFDLLRWLTGQEVSEASGRMGKQMLPEYPEFYDTAAVQVELDQGTVAQLYADWHAPEKCWTWGDGRIFVTGTKGSAEIRLAGDPAVSNEEELLLMMTHEQAFMEVPLRAPIASVTEDFLRRVRGESHDFTHQDLLEATKATLLADEQAKRVKFLRPIAQS